jgi:sirohydrochlorin ferrochelatase
MTEVVLASHGTSDSVGAKLISDLVKAIAAELPTQVVHETFVDVQEPQVLEVVENALKTQTQIALIPLLLSTGYHVRQDITDAVITAMAEFPGSNVAVTPALGPSTQLTTLLLLRLQQAGWSAGDIVVLAVAGSSDSAAVEECRLVHLELEAAIQELDPAAQVELAFLSAAQPRLKDLVPKLKFQHPSKRVVVSTYLLAPGYFADQTAKVGAHLVAEPLLAKDSPVPGQLVDLILSRVSQAKETKGTLGCLRAYDSSEPDAAMAEWSCAAGCSRPCR